MNAFNGVEMGLVGKVRLSDRDLKALEEVFKQTFLQDDNLWIFGSRVDMSKKGGDIDLYVETHAASIDNAIKMRSNFVWNLEQKIGEQKIDVVLNMINFPYPLPIHDVAKSNGVKVV